MRLLIPASALVLLTACGPDPKLPPPPDAGDTQTPTDNDGGSDGDTSSDGGSDGDTDTPAPPDSALVFTGPRPRNVLLVSIDTLRRGDMSRYDGSDTTPNLDAWLEGALVLERHRSCTNWTYPALTCVFTGLYNEALGHYPYANNPLPDDITTMAEILGERGYRSRLVGAQGVFDPGLNLVQGYGTVETQSGWKADEVTEEALAAAAEILLEDSPWLFHVHYLDPHAPYTPPDKYLRGTEGLPEIPYDFRDLEFMANLNYYWNQEMDAETQAAVLQWMHAYYDGELRFLDDQLARLLSELEAMGALDETLVVMFSDHGEQFFEHGEFEHGLALYTEETLALSAIWAANLQPGTVDFPTTHTDFLPTVLYALDLPGVDGLSGAVPGQSDPDRPVFASMYNDIGIALSVEIGDDRLVYKWSGPVDYFDESSDPDELVDLYDPELAEVQALWEALAPMSALLEDLTGESPADPVP